MKKFTRVLAMLIALVMVLAVLPISAIADTWLNVEAEKETNDNVTTTDVTVTVDPYALLSYLQDGDLKGLLKGMDASGGLGSIMTKEELLAIVPEDQIIDLVKSVIADIDARDLLACIDADELLACVDKAGLVALIKEMDLSSYVKDFDLLMSYVDAGAIESAVAYINTEKLVSDNADKLAALVLGLDQETLMGVLDEEAVLDLFTEDELLDFVVDEELDTAALKAAVKGKLQALTSEELIACLVKVDGEVDYTTVVKTVGVKTAIDAIGGYEAVIGYVTNYKALVGLANVDAIAVQILKDRTITAIVDAEALIKDINMRALVSMVDVKQVVVVIYNSGVAQELYAMLDFEEYIVQAFNILATLQKTITEIEIDGTVITAQNESGYIQLLPARLIDSLENLVPTLNELANIDDSGKLFTATFAISYLDENGVEQTKRINFNFVLTAGTDMIRSAAIKLSILMDKVGYVGLAGGELVADITIPSEFATVLRLALEAMADSTDPEFNALKDKVLAVYAAQPNDFIAFAEGLTFEEVLAVLDAVDPALFGKVYSKALASSYAQVLLDYVENVTGYDFSDNLEAQNLINTIAEIPTFEVFVQKLENVTGIEITDRLPGRVNGYLDHTVYEVFDKLGEVAGYDFDMQNLLKQAAASTDPFAYLYTVVVNKVENCGAIYSFVKRNTIKVADRLMATRFGAVVADNCLMDFYRGNSTFVFDKDVTFDAKVVLEKGLNRVLGVADNYVPGVESKLDSYISDVLDVLISDGATVHTGFDVTIHVNNLYRVDFVDAYGTTFLSTLLPAGTDLSKMVDYTGTVGFTGWLDAATGAYVTVMPAKDVVLKADVQGITQHTVTIIPVDENGNVLAGTASITVTDGERLGKYLPALNAAAKTLYPALSAEEVLLGYAYSNKWDDAIFAGTVEGDKTVYVTIVLNKNTENSAIQIGDLVADEDFTIALDGGKLTVTLSKNWNTLIEEKGLEALNFEFAKALLETLDTLVLTANATPAQKVTLNKAMLALLVYDANELPVEIEEIGLSYAPVANATEGAESYEFLFTYDGQAADLGNFKDGATVEIVLPFAGKNTAGVKTFGYVDGEALEINEENVTDTTVAFNAPHFSTFTLVNKYRVTINEKYAVESIDPALLPDVLGPIVTANIETYYAPGETVGTFAIDTNGVPAGLEYSEVRFNDTAFTGSFTMPAEPVTVTAYLTAKVYNVFYHVNNKVDDSLTVSYTIFDKPATATLFAVKPTGTYTGNWFWYCTSDITADKLGTQDFNLFWINPAQTELTIEFYKTANEATPVTYTKTIAAWRDGAFADLASQLVKDGLGGYVWKTVDNSKNLNELTLGELIAAGSIKFYGTKVEKQYNVFVDGNVTVNKNSANEGDVITVTGNRVGYTAKIEVYMTLDGAQRLGKVDVTANNTFTMPACNVIIVVVEETPVSITYIDKDGNEKTAPYGTVNTIVITVPADSTFRTDLIPGNDICNLSAAPAGLVLAGIANGANGSTVYTYQYTLTESVDEKAFIEQVKAVILPAEYVEEEAPEADETPDIATAKKVSPWLIVCIILAVLLLIALIALVYVLHVTDRVGTNWLTKACTAIVTAFFAFCMLVAKGMVKLLGYVGIKFEDILDELPAPPVEDIPAVLIDPETLSNEEAVEEAIEETAEEAPVEEVAEEEVAVEETVEEAPAEEATEEAPQEEAAAEEEAAVEEAVEEAPQEEATEETAEEVVEEEQKDE